MATDTTAIIKTLGVIVAKMVQGEVPDADQLAEMLAELERAHVQAEAPAVAAQGFDQVLKAIQAVMEDVKNVPKNGHNSFHNYRYVLASDLLAALQPACVRHGLVIFPSLEGQPTLDQHGNTTVVMNYRLAHVSGQVWPFPVRIPGAGNDKSKNGNSVGDKGVYKALTGAQKYFLQEMFQIPTGDDVDTASDAEHDGAERDGDNRSRQRQRGRQGGQPSRPSEPRPGVDAAEATTPVTQEQADKVKAAFRAKGYDDAAMLSFVQKRYPEAGLVAIGDLSVLQGRQLVERIIPNLAHTRTDEPA